MHAAPTEFQRHIEFAGSYNFRDLGGYATTDGRVTRSQHLYRADGPHALTPDDLDKLRALGLATVIDLRTAQEAADRGRWTASLPDVAEHNLSMIDVLPDAESLPEWIDPQVVAVQYRNMLEQGQSTIASALGVLSTPGAYPAMFHCSAGKDRTGVLAALVLGLVGVPDAVIVADYALSAAAMQRLIDFYKQTYPDAGEQLTRLAPAMVAAHPDAMQAFIEGLRRDYGTFADYAAAIGVDDAAPALRAALLTAS